MHSVTYDVVKEHIIQEIQKMFKYGLDIAKAICNGVYMKKEDLIPVRRLTEIYHDVEGACGDVKRVSTSLCC